MQSPADLGAMIGIVKPSEEDVLHAENLPRFGDTLSAEESETLLSYLTVPYMRIPLIASFFASRDRVTYLFNEDLQRLFYAVLFEAGDWVDASERERTIDRVPIRLSGKAQDKDNIEMHLESMMGRSTRGENVVDTLGTASGLLLNELLQSPAASLEPILKMLGTVHDLAKASVNSPDATFILYMVDVAIAVEGYVIHAIDGNRKSTDKCLQLQQYLSKLRTFLRGPVMDLLLRWKNEAESNNDMPTASVVHSFLALVWCNVRASELTSEVAGKFLGSLCYVRNWHGFSLGKLRSQRRATTADVSDVSPEERLLRFMQAYGIDTSRVTSESIAKYVKGKPLYLRVGRKTVRAPLVGVNIKENERLPPSDVPEHKLFSALQQNRRAIVECLSNANGDLCSTLNSMVRVALRKPEFECSDWRTEGGATSGRYVSDSSELTIDVQSAEILWRSGGMKPVPDSMTLFPDYADLFQKQNLHCGLVSRQAHRTWVHIVGTEYDLLEWDEGSVEDQGCGAAMNAPPEGASETEASGSLFWSCPICTFLNASAADGASSSLGVEVCGACGSPRPGAKPPQPPPLSSSSSNVRRRNMAGRGAAQGRLAPSEPLGTTSVLFQGITYSRHVDPYRDYEKEPWPHQKSEGWILELLLPVLRQCFPEQPESESMKWKLYLPTATTPAGTSVVRLIGCDAGDKPNATWKEVVVHRNLDLVECFHHISHGRRMYRQLAYSSNAALSLSSLPLNAVVAPNKALHSNLINSCGSFKALETANPSLSVVRKRPNGTRELYIPSRLLKGIIPEALLERYAFWQSNSGILTGEAKDSASDDTGVLEVAIDSACREARITRNEYPPERAWAKPAVNNDSTSNAEVIVPSRPKNVRSSCRSRGRRK